MKTLVRSACPYCQKENATQQDLPITYAPATDQIIVTCDSEEGGCDKPYVVFIRIPVNTESKAIQGI
jgi:hypothetical protein